VETRQIRDALHVKSIEVLSVLARHINNQLEWPISIGGRIRQKYISKQRLWHLIDKPGKTVTYCQILQLALKKPAV
jgi:hypothetical protein